MPSQQKTKASQDSSKSISKLNRKKRTDSKYIRKHIREIIQMIPGYDPYDDCKGYHFDIDKALNAIEFFHECLQHIKGKLANQPLILEFWQQAIIANIYGWVDDRGLRRFQEVFIFIPRKNGKSIMAAGLCLFSLFCDGEQGAEIVCAAAEKDQARLVWDVAKEQIKREPILHNACTIFQHSIVIEEMASSLKPISADAHTKHGFNLHMASIDELHVHKTPDLIETLETSVGSRDQPLIVHLTTSDYERPRSICNMKHEYATKVRDGVFPDPNFLPVIYEATDDDDWTDKAVWKKCNPNIGISFSWNYMKRQFKKAQQQPQFENTFKRLHLNIRTQKQFKWIDLKDWDVCRGDLDFFELEKSLEGCLAYAGLDLSSVIDLTSFSLYFPKEAAVLVYSFMPKDNAIKRQDQDKVPYVTWCDQGFLTMTPGNVVDYDYVHTKIESLSNIYKIKEINIDRWNSTATATHLKGKGFKIIDFGQGYGGMTAPTKQLQVLIFSNQIKHGGHPVLRWAVSNVVCDMNPAGDLKPNKDKSADKIDPVVATIMGIGGAMIAPEKKQSVYMREKRGLIKF